MTDDQSKRDLQLDMKLNLYVFNQVCFVLLSEQAN